MGRKWPEHFQLPDKRYVGYSIKRRGKVFVVRYETAEGNHERKSTGKDTLAAALTEAAKLVLKAYGFGGRRGPVTWDDVDEKLRQALTVNNNRRRTYEDYASVIRVLRAIVHTDGPADVDATKAKTFVADWITGTYTRGKGEGSVAYARRHTGLNSYVRKLRSLWSKWLTKQFGLVTTNPWTCVDYDKTDAPVAEYPEEEAIEDFLKWVSEQYPGWELPILFLQTKAVLGRRLEDICSLRSGQLANGSLTMDSEQLRAHTYRRVLLPAELYAKLDALKGETYLWERYSLELREVLHRQKRHARKLVETFSPSAMYWFANSLFRDYNKTHERKVRSHDFRRRAIDMAFNSGYDFDTAARMFGLDHLTARRYHEAWQKRNPDARFKQMGPTLVPCAPSIVKIDV
jgi:hypothetical protein